MAKIHPDIDGGMLDDDRTVLDKVLKELVLCNQVPDDCNAVEGIALETYENTKPATKGMIRDELCEDV